MTPGQEQPSPSSRRKWVSNIVIGIFVVLLLAVLALGAVPAGLLRGVVSEKLQGASERDVEIGTVSRDNFFSYSPVITVENIRVAQPSWAGKGDFLTLKSISARVSVLDILTGAARPDRVRIDGLDIALVRDKNGRSNWHDGDDDDRKGSAPVLTDLDIVNSRCCSLAARLPGSIPKPTIRSASSCNHRP